MTTNDTDRLKFLYDRIYQRPPSDEEAALGLEFVQQTPLREESPAVVASKNDDGKKLRPGQRNRLGANAGKRAPLTSWQEYAQALLQANETSFVN